MSRQNVEVVREAFEAFADRDLDRLVDLVSPEVELHNDESAILPLEQRSWKGRQEVLDFLTSFLAPWENFRVEPSRFIDAGDRVVVLLEQFARHASSNAELKMTVGHVYTLRDGHIVDWATYVDPAAALEAAGLSE